MSDNDPAHGRPSSDLFSTLTSTSPVPLKYAHHLHTNYIPPTPTELSELQSFSSTLSNAASALSTSISTLEQQLSALQTRYSQLKEAAAPYEALASAFRRFPPELMQCIFLHCLPGVGGAAAGAGAGSVGPGTNGGVRKGRNAVMHASEAPVLLGRVCSGWRRIVMHTPALWASLHIVPPNYSAEPPSLSVDGGGEPGASVGGITLREQERVKLNEARFLQKRDIVAEWLGRSGTCPLSISFVWFGGESDEEMRLCAPLLDVLVPLSARWAHLEFQAPLKVFSLPFSRLRRTDVPRLEALSLTDNRSHFELAVRWPESLEFAREVCGLRKLSLTFFSGGIQLPSVQWAGLTELYLESNISFFFRDGGHMMETLGLCTELEECTLKFPLSHTAAGSTASSSSDAYVASRGGLVTMPRLRVLCIDGDQNLYSAFHVTTTLAGLRAPRLTLLEIYGRSGPPPEGATATPSSNDDTDNDNIVHSPEPMFGIRQLLRQSGCPLERLRLESVTMLQGPFIDCLKLAPTIKELVLRDYGWRLSTCLSSPSSSVLPTGGAKDGQTGSEDSILRALLAEGQRAPLAPNLVTFDVTLCDASQHLFCDFVESRLRNVREGVQELRSVRCAFTAREEKGVQSRIEGVKEAGLDVQVTFHLPMSDDISPSAWTGIEGL